MNEAEAWRLIEKHKARVTFGAVKSENADFGWKAFFRRNDARVDVTVDVLVHPVGNSFAMTMSGDPIAYWYEVGRGATLVEAVEQATKKEFWALAGEQAKKESWA